MNKITPLLTLFCYLLGHHGFAQNESDTVSTVYELSELDQAPVPYLQIAPTYPTDLKANRVRGHVNVVFIVDEEGHATDFSIEESSHKGFNEAALTAVKKWRFKPGLFENQAVKTRVRLPVEFELKPIEAYDIDEVDVKPVPTKRVAPEYPPALKRARKQAKVDVSFVVNESGWVVDWEVENSTNPRFNESALAAVRQWKFKPGIKDGEPVKVRVRLPLSYTLRR